MKQTYQCEVSVWPGDFKRNLVRKGGIAPSVSGHTGADFQQPPDHYHEQPGRHVSCRAAELFTTAGSSCKTTSSFTTQRPRPEG